MTTSAFYDSPWGRIRIDCGDGFVTCIRRANGESAGHCPTALSDEAARQLAEYFSGRRKCFDLPIRPEGTPFQLSVWNALLQIPYGETRSYQQIAAAVGNPKAVRAVGMACNRNPIWIVIPCHRVVGKNQSLTGYAGGLGMKQDLLALEANHI